MERKILILDNHKVNPVLGEDALDFNFDGDEENSPASVKSEVKVQEEKLPEVKVQEENLPQEIKGSPITSNDTEAQTKPSSRNRDIIRGENAIQMFKRKFGQGVPFIHNLGNPLRPKDLLVIEGVILKHGLRFTINFLFGFNDIIFHLNPRLDQNYIARNTFLDGLWGDEEGFGLMKSPLQSGKHFQIMVFISPDAYMVCVNGFHMFSFAHRVPPQNVEKIEIFGDIDLKNAALLTSEVYPDTSLMKYKKQYETLHLPFTYRLDENLKSEFKIEIKGKIKLLPVSFRINLQSADQVYPHPLIPYHLNVRYAPECYVVQNSWGFSGKSWDEEIRSALPLSWSPGRDCEINIFIYDSYIHVKGENWSLPVFKLRLNMDNAQYIYIQGDITMTFFKITSFRERDELPDPSLELLD